MSMIQSLTGQINFNQIVMVAVAAIISWWFKDMRKTRLSVDDMKLNLAQINVIMNDFKDLPKEIRQDIKELKQCIQEFSIKTEDHAHRIKEMEKKLEEILSKCKICLGRHKS